MDNWTILTESIGAKRHSEDNIIQSTETEDRDSGMESDVEDPGLQPTEDWRTRCHSIPLLHRMCSLMGRCSIAPSCALPQSPSGNSMILEQNTMTSAMTYGCSSVDRSTLRQLPGNHHCVASSTNNVTNNMNTEHLFNPAIQQSVAFRSYSHDVNCTQDSNPDPDRNSLTNCSDYERCGLDYEPDSSEDELSIINCIRDQQPEKRKWSRGIRCNSCEDNSESSDEDLRDSTRKPKLLKFGSSPPKGVHRLGNTLSPAQFMANLSFRTVGLPCVPPRKRHKQTNTYPGAASHIQRPCLDFEKMQLHWLRHKIKHRRRRLVPQ